MLALSKPDVTCSVRGGYWRLVRELSAFGGNSAGVVLTKACTGRWARRDLSLQLNGPRRADENFSGETSPFVQNRERAAAD